LLSWFIGLDRPEIACFSTASPSTRAYSREYGRSGQGEIHARTRQTIQPARSAAVATVRRNVLGSLSINGVRIKRQRTSLPVSTSPAGLLPGLTRYSKIPMVWRR